MAGRLSVKTLKVAGKTLLTAGSSRSNNVTGGIFMQGRAISTSMPTDSARADLPAARYGGRQTITLMPGDGVCPELCDYVQTIFKYAGAPVDFEIMEKSDNVVDDLQQAIMSVKRNKVALKGNFAGRGGPAKYGVSQNIEFRSELDLFANVVHVKTVPGIPARHKDIDIMVIRENTEGEYSNLEHENVGGVVEGLKIITEKNSTKIAKFAFDYATKYGRKKVTAVHKANIMKLADGLFLECCTNVSKGYPDIEFEGMIVDNCSMQMVSRPQQFDVMVLPNLYGNIISNIGAGIIGGPGIVSGVNLGDKYAVFEMGTRNTGKNIAGKNVANPCGMILAGADMLSYCGLKKSANLIKEAVNYTLSVDKIHTPDIGGYASSEDVVNNIVEYIQKHSVIG